MLDLQTLDYNYFWFERPKAVVHELKNYFDKVEDITGLGESTPVLAVNDIYHVFLPTSLKDNNDNIEYNKYTVMRETNEYSRFDSLDDVIDFIDTMIKEDRPVKTKDVVHRMAMIIDDLREIKSKLISEFPNGFTDDLHTHFLNIEIACDLNSEECMLWKLYGSANTIDLRK
jgi:hypothetical protein